MLLAVPVSVRDPLCVPLCVSLGDSVPLDEGVSVWVKLGELEPEAVGVPVPLAVCVGVAEPLGVGLGVAACVPEADGVAACVGETDGDEEPVRDCDCDGVPVRVMPVLNVWLGEGLVDWDWDVVGDIVGVRVADGVPEPEPLGV